jgi:hypothetical protein
LNLWESKSLVLGIAQEQSQGVTRVGREGGRGRGRERERELLLGGEGVRAIIDIRLYATQEPRVLA